jgi:hypothetical protein
MQGISQFFDRFRNVALKEIRKREIISKAVSSVLKKSIDSKDIDIKNGVITIKGGGMLKSEIFLKKKLIIDQISKEGIKIVDIK